MKYLRVTMSDGSKWDVPARIIANDRALYYAKKEAEGEGAWEEIYNDELAYTMSDNSELIDWAANNMNWEDVVSHATKFEYVPDVDYQEGWVNGEKEIVDHE